MYTYIHRYDTFVCVKQVLDGKDTKCIRLEINYYYIELILVMQRGKQKKEKPNV